MQFRNAVKRLHEGDDVQGLAKPPLTATNHGLCIGSGSQRKGEAHGGKALSHLCKDAHGQHQDTLTKLVQSSG